MVDNAIQPAIRTALRFHEIGNDTPYRISFAGKGKSGGSFGFMQGDLAAGQPDVTRTFREAMTRAQMSAQKINGLIALLSRHQIRNPLSDAETKEIDAALRASSMLVDQMDDSILAQVYRDLDTCLAVAERHQCSVAPKAQIYMALWINMSGPPTKLLTWLEGGDPHLGHVIPKAGSHVDGDDMENYLAATSYYIRNPQNLAHLHACAAKGMQALGGEAVGNVVIMAMDAGVAPGAVASPDEVRIAATSSTGGSYVVGIRKTGGDRGTINVGEANAAPRSFNVTNIMARADGTRLTCSASFVTVTCALRAGVAPNADSIAITIGGLFGSTTIYTTRHDDFERLRDFIARAGFPVMPATAPSPRGAVAAFAENMVPMIPAPDFAGLAGAAPDDRGFVAAALAPDMPPPVEFPAAAAAGGFAERAVQIAIGEWEKFGRQTYDIRGHLVQQGHTETQDPWYKIIGQYWKFGVGDDTLDGRDNVPWSAAFISWVMRSANAGDRFHYSQQHSVYISRAIRDLARTNMNAGYWCYRLHAMRPSPGDLVCWGRQAGIDYDNQHGGDYKGHCDVVVAVGGGQIEIIGGNVGNSVTRRPLALNADGTIKPTNQHGENLFGLMKCRL